MKRTAQTEIHLDCNGDLLICAYFVDNDTVSMIVAYLPCAEHDALDRLGIYT